MRTDGRALTSLLHRYGFKGPPYPHSIDLVEALRAEATTVMEQNLIIDLFERVILYARNPRKNEGAGADEPIGRCRSIAAARKQ